MRYSGVKLRHRASYAVERRRNRRLAAGRRVAPGRRKASGLTGKLDGIPVIRGELKVVHPICQDVLSTGELAKELTK